MVARAWEGLFKIPRPARPHDPQWCEVVLARLLVQNGPFPLPAAMPYHTVVPGDCFSSLAAQYGFADYRTIYDDGANADLRGKRTNPNVLLPGDRVFIPERDETPQDCPTDGRHRFVVKRKTTRLRLVLKDRDGALANRPFKLSVAGEPVAEGSTDGSGLIDKPIPADAGAAVLEVQRTEKAGSGFLRWQLQLGFLDPHDHLSGAQARLNNLGFFCGKVDGILGPRTARALRQFQKSQGLAVSGKLDGATAAKLRGGHDSA